MDDKKTLFEVLASKNSVMTRIKPRRELRIIVRVWFEPLTETQLVLKFLRKIPIKKKIFRRRGSLNHPPLAIEFVVHHFISKTKKHPKSHHLSIPYP